MAQQAHIHPHNRQQQRASRQQQEHAKRNTENPGDDVHAKAPGLPQTQRASLPTAATFNARRLMLRHAEGVETVAIRVAETGCIITAALAGLGLAASALCDGKVI